MQTETMNVTGMTCGGCVGKVTQALTAVPGVAHVDVSLPGRASVEFDEKLTSRERLQSAVTVRRLVTVSRSAKTQPQVGPKADAAADLVNGIELFSVAGFHLW